MNDSVEALFNLDFDIEARKPVAETIQRRTLGSGRF